MLNELSSRIGKRKGTDVSNIFRAKQTDELHVIAVELFKKLKKG